MNSAEDANGTDGAARPYGTLVTTLSALAAAWIGVGATGLIDDPLRHGLMWVMLGISVLANGLTTQRGWFAWLVLLVAISLGLIITMLSLGQWVGLVAWLGVATPFTALSLPVVDVFMVAMVLAAVAMGQLQPARHVNAVAAMAIAVMGLFELVRTSVPVVWIGIDAFSGAIGAWAGLLAHRKLWVGASFAGIDFLVLMLAFYVGWLILSPRPRMARACWGLLAICVGHLVYLVVVARFVQIRQDLTSLDQPAASALFWRSLTWHLPALAGLIHLAIAAVMVGGTSWSGPAKKTGAVGRVGWVAAALLAVVIPASSSLFWAHSSLEGKKVVVYEKGFLNWLKPEHGDYGKYAIGMYGLFPTYVESLGATCVRSADLSDADLEDADVLVLLYPNETWRPQQLDRIKRFVDGGGSLLVMGEHTIWEDLFTVGWLFSADNLDGQVERDLDNGELTPSVRETFDINAQALSAEARVSVMDPGRRWLISDGSTDRTIVKAGKMLHVYSFVDQIDAEVDNYLDRQGISDQLRKAFASHQIMLTDAVTVAAFKAEGDAAAGQPRRWVLSDGEHRFDIVRHDKVVATLDPGYQDQLDEGFVPVELAAQLAAAGRPLSETATVSVQEQAKAWLIADQANRYRVLNEAGVLNVHAPHLLRIYRAGQVDDPDNRFNDILKLWDKQVKMRVQFDSATFEVGGWLKSYESLAHPVTAGIGDDRNQFGSVIGGTIRTDLAVRPLLVGRWGWADPGELTAEAAAMMGDSRYSGGERLGDLVLAAEQSVGAGTIVCYGDPSTMTNGITVGSHVYTSRLLGYLATRKGNRHDGWRQVVSLVLGLLLAALLIGLQPSLITLAVAPLLAISLICVQQHSHRTGELVPDGRRIAPGHLAYIDESHLAANSGESWRPDGLMGLTMTLMRSGFLTLGLPELHEARLLEPQTGELRARVLVLVAPARPFTDDQRDLIRRFVEAGGILICTVGYEQRGPSEALLRDFGFEVGRVETMPDPLFVVDPSLSADLQTGQIAPGLWNQFMTQGVTLPLSATVSLAEEGRWVIHGDGEDFLFTIAAEQGRLVVYPPGRPVEPQPMGFFKSPYLSNEEGQMAYVRFYAAWPVAPPETAQVVARGAGDLPVAIVRPFGQGKVVVVGDTGFAMNKNLENEEGYPFDEALLFTVPATFEAELSEATISSDALLKAFADQGYPLTEIAYTMPSGNGWQIVDEKRKFNIRRQDPEVDTEMQLEGDVLGVYEPLYENADFWRWFLTDLTGRDTWYPARLTTPRPPAAQEVAP